MGMRTRNLPAATPKHPLLHPKNKRSSYQEPDAEQLAVHSVHHFITHNRFLLIYGSGKKRRFREVFPLKISVDFPFPKAFLATIKALPVCNKKRLCFVIPYYTLPDAFVK